MGKAEETRKAIIGKAAAIFYKNGYQRISMSTLSKAMGLPSTGTLPIRTALPLKPTGHVSGRERVRFQLHERSVDKLRAFFDEIMLSGEARY